MSILFQKRNHQVRSDKHRSMRLETLEARCLLSINPTGVDDSPAAFAAADASAEAPILLAAVADGPVINSISVSKTIPAAAEVDDVDTLTSVDAGDTVYVSIYIKSTDPDYGILSGYCSLYFDIAGFTPGAYIPSNLYPNDTRNDGYDFSTDQYISTFGGNPASMTESYGQTQWALVGTQTFTADASGTYEFSTGMARNKNGVEKANWGFTREDYPTTREYGNPVTFLTVTVTGSEDPMITDVTLESWEGTYDGAAHAITVNGIQVTDTVLYSTDGQTYDLTENPSYIDVGTYTTYVKVSRDGYQDWTGSSTVTINEAAITDVSLSGVTVDYDGAAHAITVNGIQVTDTVLYSTDGQTYDLTENPSYIDVGAYTTYVKVSRDNHSDWYGSAVVTITGAGPDLSTTSVTAATLGGEVIDIFTGGLEAGTPAVITVRYTNSGDPINLKYFYSAVRLRNDTTGDYILKDSEGNWYERYSTGNLGTGDSGTFKFTIPRLAVGSYTIEVQLDNRGVVAEGNENNNYSEHKFSVFEGTHVSDLVLGSVTAVDKYTDEIIDIVNAGMTTTNTAIVTVQFINNGPDATSLGNFYNAVRVKNSDTGEYVILNSAGDWYERYYNGGVLEQGDSGAFSFLMPKLTEGNYTIEVQLDNRGVVEHDPEGNYYTIDFTIPMADLVNTGVQVVDKITGNAVDFESGITTSVLPVFTVSYMNQGETLIPKYFYSQVQVVNSDGVAVLNWYDRYCAAGLGAGESGSFNFVIPKQAAGTYTMKVQLDSRQAVAQSNYDNDYIEYTFTVTEALAAEWSEIFTDETFIDELLIDL